MKRVLVDLLFYTGTKGGMESYVREVYSRLSPDDPELEYVALASSELAATDTSWFPGRVVDSGISGEDRVAWARGELFSLGGAARRHGADLVHCPANFGPCGRACPWSSPCTTCSRSATPSTCPARTRASSAG